MIMRKRRQGAGLDQMSTQPTYLTTLGPRLPDGRCRSSMDGTVWLYRAVPLSPVDEAKDRGAQLRAMKPLFDAYEAMAEVVSTSAKRRFVARSSYRRTHALLLNVPQLFRMPWSHPIAGYLNDCFGHRPVDRRLLLFGVQLDDRVGGGGSLRDRIDSLSAFLADHQIPMGDFDEDFAVVDAALARVGLTVPSAAQFQLADAYWNRGDGPATPTLNHLEHIHVFHSPDSMRLADLVGTDNCAKLEAVPNQGAVTYAAVTEFRFDWESVHDQKAAWVSDLLRSDALAVSVRGLVEPASITRNELRAQRSRFVKDISERQQAGKLSRAEQDTMLEDLTLVEQEYATGRADATLVDASVIVAFSGIQNMATFNQGKRAVTLGPMTLTQPGAMAETWLCSTVQANPFRHDIPVQVIAASGMTSLGFVGDRDGALMGLTERDQQPALLSPTAASRGDKLPIFLCAGATGSGKSMLLMWLAYQWSMMGHSGVIIDPKQGSDFSEFVVNVCAGQVIKLDDITSADGIFDPIRFALDSDVGVLLAQSVLLSVNPWGRDKEDCEQPILVALQHGVSRGATCVGQALRIAQDEIPDKLPARMVSRVLDLAESSATFSAMVGMNPTSTPLSVARGLTLIMVGHGYLDVPKPGKPADDLSKRTAAALVRMMVFGSAYALTARGGGFIELDEAYTFLGETSEMDVLGRVARQQRVLPCLFTQRVTDALDAGLKGYIGRMAIGALSDDKEALSACLAGELDPELYLPRIQAPGTLGGTSESKEIPNWESLEKLRDPDTGRLLRGSIFLYADLHNRVIPVEVTLPADFLRRVSTNPDDVDARREQERQLSGV